MELSLGDERRKNIFKKFSKNLKEYLEFHKMCIEEKSEGLFHRIDKDVYICPLCNHYYYEESIYSSNKGSSDLTLEHNPPKSVGGPASILTCFKCNNTNGSNIDPLFGLYFNSGEFLKGKESSVEDVNYKIGGYKISGDIKYHNNGLGLIFRDSSNPYAISKLFGNNEINNINKLEISLQVPNIKILCKSLLKVAHLTAFKVFGYTYLQNVCGQNVIRVLKGDLEYPCINYGVLSLDMDEKFKGINVITQPSDLQGLLIVEKSKIKDKVKYIGIILPTPNESGWKSLANYNSYKKKEVEFKTTRYVYQDFPCLPDQYYKIFKDF